MKIAGIWSGHDCSFCILEDGHPVVHAELERYIREKEPQGDAAKFMFGSSFILSHSSSILPAPLRV